MRTLITGGTGLIGRQFSNGVKIGRNDYNLLDESQVIKMYETIQPTHVIHTAARVGGIKANMNHLADFYYENIKSNTLLIHYAHVYGVKKLIAFSSTCVFPQTPHYPLTEDQMHLSPPHPSNYAYAYAKRMVDIQIQAYHHQYHCHYFSVIPASVYGPYDNFHLDDAHVIPALIHKVHVAQQKNEALTVWGSGKAEREFVFSKDVARICELLIEKHNGPDPVIISQGVGGDISIEELVVTICELYGFKNQIIFDSSQPEGQLKKPSSNERLLSIIGPYSFIPLREGLSETIEWFKRSYPNVRK